jgi:hypothetical protein
MASQLVPAFERHLLSNLVQMMSDGIPASLTYEITTSRGNFESLGHLARALARSSSPLILL